MNAVIQTSAQRDKHETFIIFLVIRRISTPAHAKAALLCAACLRACASTTSVASRD
jgi:hypothetical protein